VWLGRARLELLFGDETTARQWLDRCRRQDPGPESAVDLAELDWSLAAGDASIARRSLEQLLPGSIGLRAQAAAAAWFAARRGDRSSEFDRLKDLVELDPAAPRAWDRLAELASLDGDADGAAEFRARKAAIEPIRERYLVAMRAPDIRAHAARLADLARSLGRMRDALGWAKLATNDSSVAAANLKESESPLADRIRRNLLAELEHTVDRQADGLSSAVVFPRFEDRAASAGVTFLHRNGGAAGRLIPPVTASGGVALFDYDRDGWLDLYIVQGGDFPPRPDASPTAGDRLYRNRRDGTFEDVTEAAGLGGYRGYGHGVTVGDINNDGWPDLFVTRWRAYALYLNRSDGTFEEITERAGFAGDRDWPTSAAFADIDQDGDLDLYVCHYLSWNEGEERVCSDPKDPAVYRCAPRDFPALPDHLFRNDNGQFVDISESARITSADSNGRGLGVAAGDFDDDGRIDFYVANDTTANYLFRNLGDGQFEEIAHAAGAAANATGGYQAGMGIARGDLDGDGRLDLAVTNFFNESTTFFHSLDVPGTAAFADHTSAINLLAPSRGLLGFGIVFLDANNDGKLDVLTANGHVHDGRPLFPWTMPTQLLLTGTDGRLIDAGRRAGDCFATPHLGRGLAAGDLDNDGRIDAVLVSQNEAPVVYGNRTDSPGHFLTLGLEGAKGSNRDAIGARVTVVTSLASQVAERTGGGSYQSASEPRMHFGLGAAERIESITVRWPSGRSERYDGALPDHGYLLKEESRELRPLPGWAHVPSDPESRLSPSPSRTSP
jgi:hypothetical protein